MPASSACVLDPATQANLLEILGALRKETDSIEVDGQLVSVDALIQEVSSCVQEASTPERQGKKRGPKTPSAYNLFIGQCRTPADKGGMGKDFSECVELWKQQKGQ